MPHFANPEYFKYAWWICLSLILLWLFARWRAETIRNISDPGLLGSVFPGYSSRQWLWSGILMVLGSSFIIIALANPLSHEKKEKAKAGSLDMVIAMDVSKSMDARDIKPSRLQRATAFINKLSASAGNHRTGLVVFAGKAYVQMPLTRDPGALKLFLGSMSTDMVPEQGTDLSDAIETSKDLLFPTEEEKLRATVPKVILLITDGEDHEEKAIKAAEEARKNGVVIITVGIGSDAGAPIPESDPGVNQGYIHDNTGETVISRANMALLRDIATKTGGSAYRLAEQDDLVPVIQKKLLGMQTGAEAVEMFAFRDSAFQWFAGIALFLLMLESILKYITLNPKGRHEF